MKIVADNTIPFLKGILEEIAEIQYVPAKGFTPALIKDADVLIVRSIDKCTRQLLEGSKVRLITTATIGFDHIDTAYCDEAGIKWKNAPGCNARSVGQYILSSLVTMADKKGIDLKGKTIGIIGAGHVGNEVERLCNAFGMKVILNDPPREETEGSDDFVSLQTIAEESDIITVHTPFTKEGKYPTYHLINEDFFNNVRRTPWFINAARGAIHDTEALKKAMKDGQVEGCILDCWEKEPNIDSELLQMSFLATPHIAGFSADGKANATRACLHHIENFYGITIDKINDIKLPEPTSPIIDLVSEKDKDFWTLPITMSFSPVPLTEELKNHPDRFELMRNIYKNPREFEAYEIQGGTPKEKEFLKTLGFRIKN